MLMFLKRAKGELIKRPPRKPILVDSSLHTAFAIKYAIYAAFGLLGTVYGPPSIALVAGATVAHTVSLIIFVCSIVAMAATLRSHIKPIWKKVELYSTIGVVSFVSVYFVSAATLAVLGDSSRANLAIIAIALIVLPTWRILQIIKESRRL
jgi:hypothetical protein